MSNPLKRVLNPVEEVDDAVFSLSTGAMCDVDPRWPGQQPGQQEPWPFSGAFADAPRQSPYHGPGSMNPQSDIAVIPTVETLPELFSEILFPTTLTNQQMSPTNLYETGYDLDGALTEWGDYVLGFDSPSVTPDSSSSMVESATSADEEETICYGMLYNVDVKLVGDMPMINGKLGKGDTIYERFELNERHDHILLCFQDGRSEFGYLRSGVGKTLAPLLEKPGLEFEPIAVTSNLKETIGCATKPAEAMVKVDINVYGARRGAAEVGNALSQGKLWLQRSGHARRGVVYDNPHFLPLKINGVRVQSVQSVNQVANEGPASRKHQEDQLRKMVEEVYKSLDNTRHLNMVEGGNMVTRKLLKHQQEALGFMLERESGHINDKYRLWKTTILEDGTEEYRHRITKAKARLGIQPDERGGGILADEMGMGKSLSILALIAKTLDLGKEWAQQQNCSAEGAEGQTVVKHSHSTLVVVPSALLVYNWRNEIEIHLKRGLKVIKYHGRGRSKSLDTILDSDIVVTTYNILTAEHLNKLEPSLLHRIGWYRVVLDEAHIIRRSATFFYRACFHLHANSRWCLTGTPIQNKLADLGALFAFIRTEPFSKTSVFRKWIEVPFEQNIEDPAVVKDRLVMLLEALCLRRTKDAIQLPGLLQHVRMLEFSPAERDKYKNTEKILRRTIRHRVGEVEKSSKFGLFQVNLQLRLLCNHGTFQQPFSWNRRSYQEEREAVISALGQNTEITCSGCKLPMPILGSNRQSNGFRECAHVLCSECIEESSTLGDGAQMQHCPVCLRWLTQARDEGRATGDGDVAKKANEDDDDYYFNANGHSTKMRALIEDVRKDLWKTKSIIFSCWARTLRLLSKHLDDAKIPYLHIDGCCPPRERQVRLDQFSNDNERPVLIMTTGTGGFGLNLTCANRIFIVELQWNPAVESQAIARAIRLGQDSEVHVTRYVIKDTVEEEMRSQQKWKKQLAGLGFEEMLDVNDDETVF